jgi:hypothetical protein
MSEELEGEFRIQPDKIRSFAPALGLRVDEEGFLVDVETGDRIDAACGEPIPVEEISDLGVGDEESGHQVVPKKQPRADQISESKNPIQAD